MRYLLALMICGCTTVVIQVGGDGAVGLESPALGESARDMAIAPLDLASEAGSSIPVDMAVTVDLAPPPDLMPAPDMALLCGGNIVPPCNTSGTGPLCCNSTTAHPVSCINGYCWNAPSNYCCIDNTCNPLVACWTMTGAADGVCQVNHTCQ